MKAKKNVAKAKTSPSSRAAPSKPVRRPPKTGNVVTKAKPRRKSARPGSYFEIPPILLEDDQSAQPLMSGPGEKFTLGPTPPAPHFAIPTAELPDAYGTKRLFLTARDPHWLYANWDLSTDQQARYNKQSVDGHLILRVYDAAHAGAAISEIHVHPESRHWFAHVERAGEKYSAELGCYGKGRKWTSIARSGATLTPPATVSFDATVEFATIPVEVSFETLLALIKDAAREYLPLAQAIEALRHAGHPELPPAAQPMGRWTPEQESALAKIVSLDEVRRVWIGSLEITELIRRQLERGISSLGLSTSPGGAVSSLSSPFGGEQARGKGFWFNVNAELIVYGATERDATVMIGGRKIKLRADGSFTYRFSLPDGRYDLPVVAISSDETDGRAAELKFTRSTQFLGEVGTHPQDPTLKPPTPDNV